MVRLPSLLLSGDKKSRSLVAVDNINPSYSLLNGLGYDQVLLFRSNTRALDVIEDGPCQKSGRSTGKQPL
jgi:hypothetical protein